MTHIYYHSGSEWQGFNVNKGLLRIPERSRTGATPSVGLVLYQRLVLCGVLFLCKYTAFGLFINCIISGSSWTLFDILPCIINFKFNIWFLWRHFVRLLIYIVFLFRDILRCIYVQIIVCRFRNWSLPYPYSFTSDFYFLDIRHPNFYLLSAVRNNFLIFFIFIESLIFYIFIILNSGVPSI